MHIHQLLHRHEPLLELCCQCAPGRGGRGAVDEDEGSNFAVTDQDDDDDDHVKLLNPVKVPHPLARRVD